LVWNSSLPRPPWEPKPNEWQPTMNPQLFFRPLITIMRWLSLGLFLWSLIRLLFFHLSRDTSSANQPFESEKRMTKFKNQRVSPTSGKTLNFFGIRFQSLKPQMWQTYSFLNSLGLNPWKPRNNWCFHLRLAKYALSSFQGFFPPEGKLIVLTVEELCARTVVKSLFLFRIHHALPLCFVLTPSSVREFVVPACIVQLGDFSPRPVCSECENFLHGSFSLPAFSFSLFPLSHRLISPFCPTPALFLLICQS